MKPVLSMLTAVIVMSLYGCGEYEASKEPSNATLNTNSLQSPSVFPAADSNSVTNETQNMAGATMTASPTGVVSGAATTGAGLNPAHGQPGHRCDIAVGAPLDSKPAGPAANNNQVTTTALPAKTGTSLPAAATTPATATGLNPAHGQPGHRCDIAVGAPLNSKPGTNTTTTPAASSPVAGATPLNSTGQKTVANPIPVTPMLPTSNSQTPVPTGAGLNPAHGQPGHRCDIAVGAPLNSKPAVPVKQ